uniref:ornithine decarboxylase n=1 Tax=Stegastes partitus TaxID=144197 RepID=A0A3B5A0X3_9TELE
VSRILSLDSNNVEILEDGKTINDVIDGKIKELSAEPFYVLSLDSMLKRHLRWLTNLPRVKPFYAMKCNNTPTVVRMLMALGTGFDCASKAEIQLALSLGVTPDKIIYAHTTKPMSHIRYACNHRVDVMTFDSEGELLKISLCHPQAKLSSKFGARMSSVGKLLEQAGELGLEVIGVSFHVGSGCTGSLAYKQAIADARYVFDVASLLGFQMRLLDIGGGFSGIVINAALDKYFPPGSGVEVIAEPGRYYVESAFTLAVNVVAKRVVADEVDEQNSKCEDMRRNSPDKAMMYYINDGVYGSMSCITFDPAHSKLEPYLHRVSISSVTALECHYGQLSAVDSSEPTYPSVIWGPTCDSIDKVTENYWMPELHVGEWLLIDNMGAYSVSVSTDFNSFERARIYPVVTAKTWQSAGIDSSNPSKD